MARRVGDSLALLSTILLAHPLAVQLPRPGGDNNWVYGLNQARLEGDVFGRDIIFTAGPWGPLSYPLALDRATPILAGVFSVIALASFWWVARWALTFVSPLPATVLASALTLFLDLITTSGFLMMLGALSVGMGMLRSGRGRSPCALVLLTLVGSLLLQVRFSEGLAVLVITFVVTIANRKRLEAVWVLLAGVAGSLSLWAAAGQPVSAFDDWLRASGEIVGGYTEAMALYPEGSGWAVAAGVGFAILTVLAAMTSGVPAAFGVASGAIVWLAFKTIVRLDPGHMAQFCLLLVPIVLSSLGRGRPALLRSGLLLSLVASAAVLMMSIDKLERDDAWGAALQRLSSEDALADFQAQHREELQARYDFPQGAAERLSRGSVMVDPAEHVLAWAYQWDAVRPFTIMPYAGYSQSLDQANASILESGPDFLIRSQGALDDRLQLWDSPRYNLSAMCNYAKVVSTGPWTIFQRIEAVCGETTFINRVRAQAWQPLKLPAGGSSELISVQIYPKDLGLIETARNALWRPGPFEVRLDDQPVRLPLAHASGPLIVRLPESLEWPDSEEQRPNASTLTLPVDGEVVFERIPYMPIHGDLPYE